MGISFSGGGGSSEDTERAEGFITHLVGPVVEVLVGHCRTPVDEGSVLVGHVLSSKQRTIRQVASYLVFGIWQCEGVTNQPADLSLGDRTGR